MKRTPIFIHGIRLRYFLFLMLIGWVLSSVNALAPIHEVGHILAYQLTGIDSGFAGWATTWSTSVSNFGLAAGYFFELFCWLALFAIPKTKWRVLVTGILLEIFFAGIFSTDFRAVHNPIVYILWVPVAGFYVFFAFAHLSIKIKEPVAQKRYQPHPVIDAFDFWRTR